jgi:hypothetical protein
MCSNCEELTPISNDITTKLMINTRKSISSLVDFQGSQYTYHLFMWPWNKGHGGFWIKVFSLREQIISFSRAFRVLIINPPHSELGGLNCMSAFMSIITNYRGRLHNADRISPNLPLSPKKPTEFLDFYFRRYWASPCNILFRA